jgi:hypothetical protein
MEISNKYEDHSRVVRDAVQSGTEAGVPVLSMNLFPASSKKKTRLLCKIWDYVTSKVDTLPPMFRSSLLFPASGYMPEN